MPWWEHTIFLNFILLVLVYSVKIMKRQCSKIDPVVFAASAVRWSCVRPVGQMGGLQEPSLQGVMCLSQRELCQRPEPFRQRPEQGHHHWQLTGLVHLSSQQCSTLIFIFFFFFFYLPCLYTNIHVKSLTPPCVSSHILQIPVVSWFDDMSDTELLDLIPFFERLSKADDIYAFLTEQRTSS